MCCWDVFCLEEEQKKNGMEVYIVNCTDCGHCVDMSMEKEKEDGRED